VEKERQVPEETTDGDIECNDSICSLC
jgi:hypothetical protein